MTPDEHPIELISAMMDGEASPAERVRAEAHLLECSECRALAADLRVLGQAVAREVPPPVPPGLAGRISWAVRGEDARANARTRGAGWWIPRALGGVGAIAAALLLGLVLVRENLTEKASSVPSSAPIPEAPLEKQTDTDRQAESGAAASDQKRFAPVPPEAGAKESKTYRDERPPIPSPMKETPRAASRTAGPAGPTSPTNPTGPAGSAAGGVRGQVQAGGMLAQAPPPAGSSSATNQPLRPGVQAGAEARVGSEADAVDALRSRKGVASDSRENTAEMQRGGPAVGTAASAELSPPPSNTLTLKPEAADAKKALDAAAKDAEVRSAAAGAARADEYAAAPPIPKAKHAAEPLAFCAGPAAAASGGGAVLALPQPLFWDAVSRATAQSALASVASRLGGAACLIPPGGGAKPDMGGAAGATPAPVPEAEAAIAALDVPRAQWRSLAGALRDAGGPAVDLPAEPPPGAATVRLLFRLAPADLR